MIAMLTLTRIAFDAGLARRLIGELADAHPLHGQAIDFLGDDDASPPPGEAVTSMPRIGWCGDAVFWVDRTAREIHRWTFGRATIGSDL